MANVKDNNQPKAKDSPEEKRQKLIDEEVKEKEQLIDKTDDILVLREIAKTEIRFNVRRRLLQKSKFEAEKEKLRSKFEAENAQLRSKFEASERDKEACKEKLESITWTVRIRNLIFKVEIIFNLEKIDVCYQCGNITVWHENRQRCLYDSKTWAFPSNPEGQRIWIREVRWNYLLFTDEEVISGDFRIKNLKKALRAYYDKMKSKKEENKSLAAKALSEIPSYENFVGKFCYYVADICEYCTDRVKNQEQVELSQELRELNEFGIPSDDFMVMLVNAFGRIKKDGPRFLYKEPLDLDVNVFIPKHLRELDGST